MVRTGRLTPFNLETQFSDPYESQIQESSQSSAVVEPGNGRFPDGDDVLLTHAHPLMFFPVASLWLTLVNFHFESPF
jgi:hypothetical protein